MLKEQVERHVVLRRDRVVVGAVRRLVILGHRQARRDGGVGREPEVLGLLAAEPADLLVEGRNAAVVAMIAAAAQDDLPSVALDDADIGRALVRAGMRLEQHRVLVEVGLLLQAPQIDGRRLVPERVGLAGLPLDVLQIVGHRSSPGTGSCWLSGDCIVVR